MAGIPLLIQHGEIGSGGAIFHSHHGPTPAGGTIPAKRFRNGWEAVPTDASALPAFAQQCVSHSAVAARSGNREHLLIAVAACDWCAGNAGGFANPFPRSPE